MTFFSSKLIWRVLCYLFILKFFRSLESRFVILLIERSEKKKYFFFFFLIVCFGQFWKLTFLCFSPPCLSLPGLIVLLIESFSFFSQFSLPFCRSVFSSSVLHSWSVHWQYSFIHWPPFPLSLSLSLYSDPFIVFFRFVAHSLTFSLCPNLLPCYPRSRVFVPLLPIITCNSKELVKKDKLIKRGDLSEALPSQATI